MPAPRYRTRLLKKRSTKVPGGRVIHYKKKKVRKSKCAVCGKRLSGVPRMSPSALRKLPKTQRRPQRPYGGYLCSQCLQELTKQAART
ncbi:MAG: 50S ribosomal protein L34e [Promethearchaeota archaeon]